MPHALLHGRGTGKLASLLTAINIMRALPLILTLAILSSPAARSQTPVVSADTTSSSEASLAHWPGDAQGRLAALALLQTLNSDLLSHDSATATLERWCAAHQLASPARIVAERSHGPEQPPSPSQRRDLAVSDAEPVRHRHVRLKCGDHVLSEADNWYVPSRLTAEMNRTLETTEMPFGQVVKPLHFLRHTVESQLLWSPLPEDWESRGIPAQSGPMNLPSRVLQHRALLLLPNGLPFSEVVETYTSEVLVVPRLQH